MATVSRFNRQSISVNEQLLDSAIRHAHAIERFKSGEVRRILKFLNEQVYPDLLAKLEAQLKRVRSRGWRASERRLKQLEDMFVALDGILREGMGEAYRSLASELYSFSKIDAAWQARVVERAVGSQVAGMIGVDFVTPPPQLLRSIVVSRPFQGKHLREHFATMTRNVREGYRSAVRIGMAQGESVDTIARRVAGSQGFKGGQVIPKARREMRATVRTAVNHVSTHAREETYQANDDVIKSVQYVATLDARTTDICASLDGKEFNIGEGPRPPMHHQCRSTTVPVTKSWKELGIDLKEAPPGTRASMNGQVPAETTYGSWLKRQPASVQNEVLGAGRAKLFRDGMPIEKFVDSEYRSIPLAELEKIAKRN